MTGPCRASPVHSSFGPGGLEPAEHLRAARAGRAGFPAQLQPLEVALQRAVRGRPPRGGPQDPPDLRGGPLRVLPLERRRQLQHLGRGAGMHDRGLRHQRVEPAGPVPARPPVDGVPRQADLLPERPGVLDRGKLTRPPAPLAGAERRVDHVLDQLVPEQPDPAGPLSPPLLLVIGFGHLLSSSISGMEPADTDRKRPAVTIRASCCPARP